MTDILIEHCDAVTVLCLNRPHSLNAFTPEMIDDLDHALSTAGSDRGCRAVVLTGSGERAFCAGVDVKAVAERDAAAPSELDPIEAQFENLHLALCGIVRRIHALPVPVVAAVNGHAIGGGFAFAAACDLRIASPNATFADGFVKRGISGCEMGLSYFLPRIAGAARAFEWMTTGRRIEAEEALRAGLVSEVTEADDLVARAVALGNKIAANAPMAVRLTKEVMWANVHAASLDQALALESRTQIMARHTADAKEARQAFLEKRPPSFATPSAPRKLR